MGLPKGQTNNPNGRPRRGTALADSLRKVLAKKSTDGTVNRDAISQKLVAMCLEGNLDAIRFVYERIDGKVPDQMQQDVRMTGIQVAAYDYDASIAALAPRPVGDSEAPGGD